MKTAGGQPEWLVLRGTSDGIGSPTAGGRDRPTALSGQARRAAWLAAFRRYLAFLALANLVWEIAQLPLYTIWGTDTVGELAFAVVHCTGGDILIAFSSLLLSLVLTGSDEWPRRRFGRVAALAVGFGVGYTIFSEWLNIVVREAWQYSELMPVVPFIDTGLSPLLQWIIIPSLGLWWARRADREAADRR